MQQGKSQSYHYHMDRTKTSTSTPVSSLELRAIEMGLSEMAISHSTEMQDLAARVERMEAFRRGGRDTQADECHKSRSQPQVLQDDDEGDEESIKPPKRLSKEKRTIARSTQSGLRYIRAISILIYCLV